MGKDAIDFQLAIYTPKTKHKEANETVFKTIIVIAMPSLQLSFMGIQIDNFQQRMMKKLIANSFKIKNTNKILIQIMQAKKKAAPANKNIPKKKTHKLSIEQGETINTTKQKTFATIQQTFDFHDHKTSTRTTHYTSRRDCIDKMEAHKLSPFSSPGQSVSPRHKKSVSPVVKQKQIKRKKKMNLQLVTLNTKKSATNRDKNPKSARAKDKNSLKINASFENEVIRRLQDKQSACKKITELSQDQLDTSIRKDKKPPLLIKKQTLLKQKKNKNEIIKEMHSKIKEKYCKEYPNLKVQQMKLLAAVVLIQRLWRQTKIKMMIGSFLSPRNQQQNISYNQTFGKMPIKLLNPEGNRVEILQSERELTMKTQKSFPSISPRSSKSKQEYQKLEDLSSIENNSKLLATPEKSSLNLRDLEVSDQLSDVSSSKARQILKYIDMYREVTLNCKKDKKKKHISKPNAFNLPESLSQKCLLQSLYKKRMNNIKCLREKGEEKGEPTQIFFPSKSIEKTKQQYISPKKPEVVELEQRFYTEAQDDQYHSASKPEKQQLKLEQQTVSSIGNVATKIIQFLIFQFSEEFQAFTTKKCLKKKKRLPGISINNQTIQMYLSQFLLFTRSQYQNHFQNSFTKISGKNFLKFLRVPPQQDIFEPGQQEDEDEELNCPLIPASAFFQYQPIYEQKFFTIKEDDKKFSNFLSGLIKIHNKCLVDSFSDYFQKQRLDSISFPWDELNPAKSQQKIISEVHRKMDFKIEQIKKRIVSISNTKLGKLHKKDYDQEQINLLKSLKEDYKRQGKDWSQHQELLEVRLELTELITQQIFEQMSLELESMSSLRELENRL